MNLESNIKKFNLFSLMLEWTENFGQDEMCMVHVRETILYRKMFTHVDSFPFGC